MPGWAAVSMWKKAIGSLIGLVILAIIVYSLYAFGGGGSALGNGGGLGSPEVRTIVTLVVVGGSAFITGFGFRDVIGRAVGARQRARLAALREPKKQ